MQLTQEKYTFLYNNGTNAVFMHDTTYEQVEIPHDLVGEQKDFLEGTSSLCTPTHLDHVDVSVWWWPLCCLSSYCRLVEPDGGGCVVG